MTCNYTYRFDIEEKLAIQSLKSEIEDKTKFQTRKLDRNRGEDFVNRFLDDDEILKK